MAESSGIHTPEVLAYYFPGYHPDPRNDAYHGAGWSEWALMKAARPRFPGHAPPGVPLWGYEDESDPVAMERKIEAAADHGLRGFLFDWYWYDDSPYLNGALDRGFLPARNNDRLAFALMWANHDWMDIHPATAAHPPALRYQGAVPINVFESIGKLLVERYFLHPSYWRIDGAAFFSVYSLNSLVDGVGGFEQARLALNDLRARARRAGAGEIHLNLVHRPFAAIPGEGSQVTVDDYVDALGFDSVSTYAWVHVNRLDGFPEVDYASYARDSNDRMSEIARQFPGRYLPNVSMGWDPSPRALQSDPFDDGGYPFGPVLTANTPAEFRVALERARALAESTRAPAVLINAWNEWTEGSYLEPDDSTGYARLQAIRDVFCDGS